MNATKKIKKRPLQPFFIAARPSVTADYPM
jgi:hypothetical protein